MVHSWIITPFLLMPFPSWHSTACSLTSVLLQRWQGTLSYLVLAHGHFERVVGGILALCTCSTQGLHLCSESAWSRGSTVLLADMEPSLEHFAVGATVYFSQRWYLIDTDTSLWRVSFSVLNTLCLHSTAVLYRKEAGVALLVEKDSFIIN